MEKLRMLEEYAKENYIPIIRKDNIEYLEKLIKENELYEILELGSAIGYSAIRMALVNKNVKVTTIERDFDMINQARKNIIDFGLENQINLIYEDIFNIKTNAKFDLIFIDAAKAQYIKFFNKFEPNLKENGIIVSDNLELLDLQRLTQSKRSKRLVEKMNEYKEFLNSLENYETEYLEIGDGFAITKKVL